MLTETDAEHLVLNLFKKQGVATRLAGEEDFNFHIKTSTDDFLLKISHSNATLAHIDLQNSVLNRLKSSQLAFNTPRLQLNIHNEYQHQLPLYEPQGDNDRYRFLRLLSFIPGTLLVKARPHTEELLISLGIQIGHLSLALSQLSHPSARRISKWDLRQASWIRPHLSQLDSQQHQKTIEYFLDPFENSIVPILPTLRQSIIHGDLNDYNVIISKDNLVSGFIDFGDLIETSSVCEIAIAIAYAIMDHVDPLNAACTILKAYHSVFPLEDTEINILFVLIGMRLCTSVINSALRRKDKQDNAYLYVSEKPAWDLLKKLQTIDSNTAHRAFRNACGLDYAINH